VRGVEVVRVVRIMKRVFRRVRVTRIKGGSSSRLSGRETEVARRVVVVYARGRGMAVSIHTVTVVIGGWRRRFDRPDVRGLTIASGITEIEELCGRGCLCDAASQV
jgi:hypothetical protein